MQMAFLPGKEHPKHSRYKNWYIATTPFLQLCHVSHAFAHLFPLSGNLFLYQSLSLLSWPLSSLRTVSHPKYPLQMSPYLWNFLSLRWNWRASFSYSSTLAFILHYTSLPASLYSLLSVNAGCTDEWMIVEHPISKSLPRFLVLLLLKLNNFLFSVSWAFLYFFPSSSVSDNTIPEFNL